jgi:hypothetical protein
MMVRGAKHCSDEQRERRMATAMNNLKKVVLLS